MKSYEGRFSLPHVSISLSFFLSSHPLSLFYSNIISFFFSSSLFPISLSSSLTIFYLIYYPSFISFLFVLCFCLPSSLFVFSALLSLPIPHLGYSSLSFSLSVIISTSLVHFPAFLLSALFFFLSLFMSCFQQVCCIFLVFFYLFRSFFLFLCFSFSVFSTKVHLFDFARLLLSESKSKSITTSHVSLQFARA